MSSFHASFATSQGISTVKKKCQGVRKGGRTAHSALKLVKYCLNTDTGTKRIPAAFVPDTMWS